MSTLWTKTSKPSQKRLQQLSICHMLWRFIAHFSQTSLFWRPSLYVKWQEELVLFTDPRIRPPRRRQHSGYNFGAIKTSWMIAQLVWASLKLMNWFEISSCGTDSHQMKRTLVNLQLWKLLNDLHKIFTKSELKHSVDEDQRAGLILVGWLSGHQEDPAIVTIWC